MNKDIKDYLPYYLGCYIETNIPGKLCGTFGHINLNQWEMDIETCSYILSQLKYNSEGDYYCKPILRPLSDMSYDEREIIGGIIDPDKEYEDDYNGYNYTHEQVGQWFINHLIKNETESDTMYRPKRFIKAINTLRGMGFDCDSLIESGLAIDKTKLYNHE